MANCLVNGAPFVVGGGTIAALLDEMQLQGRKIAVEKNGAIVPKSCHGEEPLQDGDVIEIVTAVGGG